MAKIKTPPIDVSAERQLPDLNNVFLELSSAGTVDGVPIGGGVPTDISGLIPKSIVTTKGDLISATGASTPVRVGVGADGEVLTADSGAATGVSWLPTASTFDPDTILCSPDNYEVMVSHSSLNVLTSP